MQFDGTTYYTAAETAERLGIKPNTLRIQRAAGKIAARPIGRDWWYSAEAIRTYQRDHQRPDDGRSRPRTPAPARSGQASA